NNRRSRRKETRMTSRREFLAGSAALAAAAWTMPGFARAAVKFDPQPGQWRSFNIVTRIELPETNAAAQVWVPLPSLREWAWMRPVGDSWTGNADTAEIVMDPKHRARLVHARFAAGKGPAVIEVESMFSTQDRSAPFALSAAPDPLTDA